MPVRSLAEHTLSDRYSARANSATPFGFAYVPGYDPSLPVRLANVWTAARGSKTLRILDLLGVAYAILPTTAKPGPQFVPLAATPSGAVMLFRNDGRRPRAFVTSRFQWEPDDTAATQHLFDAGRPVLLAGTGTSSLGPPDAPCELAYPRPERVEMHCTAPAPAYAVLLDAFAPGWTATVDGQPAPIERAEVVARAVRLDPGAHTLVMTYRTPRLRLGGGLALVGWLLALGLLLIRR
jgi:hypothetical protein